MLLQRSQICSHVLTQNYWKNQHRLWLVHIPGQAAVVTGEWHQSVPLQKQLNRLKTQLKMQLVCLKKHVVEQLPLNLDEYNHTCLTGKASCVAISAARLTCLCDMS